MPRWAVHWKCNNDSLGKVWVCRFFTSCVLHTHTHTHKERARDDEFVPCFWWGRAGFYSREPGENALAEAELFLARTGWLATVKPSQKTMQPVSWKRLLLVDTVALGYKAVRQSCGLLRNRTKSRDRLGRFLPRKETNRCTATRTAYVTALQRLVSRIIDQSLRRIERRLAILSLSYVVCPIKTWKELKSTMRWPSIMWISSCNALCTFRDHSTRFLLTLPHKCLHCHLGTCDSYYVMACSRHCRNWPSKVFEWAWNSHSSVRHCFFRLLNSEFTVM